MVNAPPEYQRKVWYGASQCREAAAGSGNGTTSASTIGSGAGSGNGTTSASTIGSGAGSGNGKQPGEGGCPGCHYHYNVQCRGGCSPGANPRPI